jgi:hypothetical protein
MVEQSSFQSDKTFFNKGSRLRRLKKSGPVVLLARPRATRNCGRKSNFDKAQGSAHNDVADIRAWREGRPKSPKLRKPCRPFFAFDLLVLLELDGRDMRRAPIEERKAALAKLLAGADTVIE